MNLPTEMGLLSFSRFPVRRLALEARALSNQDCHHTIFPDTLRWTYLASNQARTIYLWPMNVGRSEVPAQKTNRGLKQKGKAAMVKEQEQYETNRQSNG